jgi:hypothetical protein
MFSIGDVGCEANDLARMTPAKERSPSGCERPDAYDEDCNTRHKRGNHHPDKRCVERVGAGSKVACEVRTGEASR